MIVKLTFQNNLGVPVQLFNNQGTAQTVEPGQPVQMTFAMQEGADGNAPLNLIIEPLHDHAA